MNLMRQRAKKHFPMLLATLLSIVQALALELLWSHVADTGFPVDTSLPSLVMAVQILTTFLAIVLIWVVFASAMMRFQWVPRTMESVYPFIVGVVEFMLIESLSAGNPGPWLILISVLFGLMVWISHTIMRAARHDGDQDEFFAQFKPATLKDFYRAIGLTASLLLLGTYVWLSDTTGIVAASAVLIATGILAHQFYEATIFWDESIGERPVKPDN